MGHLAWSFFRGAYAHEVFSVGPMRGVFGVEYFRGAYVRGVFSVGLRRGVLGVEYFLVKFMGVGYFFCGASAWSISAQRRLSRPSGLFCLALAAACS